MPLLVIDDVRRTYTTGGTSVTAVDGVSLALEPGDFVALMGPSGCGKSTLLHLCGAMDQPNSGKIRLESVALDSLGDDELTRIRRTRVGFVFQFFNLLPTLTVLQNVELPLRLGGRLARPALAHGARNQQVSSQVLDRSPQDATAAARALLDRVGLGPRLGHYPAQLSGGEMQRAAIARALVHQPALLIADEPTGNLDSDNGHRVLDLLVELNRETGVTMLLATHAPEIARAAHRIVRMRDGRIESEERTGAAL